MLIIDIVKVFCHWDERICVLELPLLSHSVVVNTLDMLFGDPDFIPGGCSSAVCEKAWQKSQFNVHELLIWPFFPPNKLKLLWLNKISSRIPWQASVNQLLGCLEIIWSVLKEGQEFLKTIVMLTLGPITIVCLFWYDRGLEVFSYGNKNTKWSYSVLLTLSFTVFSENTFSSPADWRLFNKPSMKLS